MCRGAEYIQGVGEEGVQGGREDCRVMEGCMQGRLGRESWVEHVRRWKKGVQGGRAIYWAMDEYMQGGPGWNRWV